MKRSTMRGFLRARDQMEDDFGVGGRLADGAAGDELAAQGQAIGEIAVVGDGEAAASSSANSGWTLRSIVSPVVE